MRILLDTNLLTRTAQSDHQQHALATGAVSVLTRRGEILCLVPQILYEFWVVCTRPAGENGLGMTPELTLVRLNEVKQVFDLLDETPAVRPLWEALVTRYHVKGKSAHDARLVAAMKAHGLTTLLTFNQQHFTRYRDLTILTPEEVLSPAPRGD